MKCDVVIPVYKSPEWVQLCLYALFVNTDKNILGKVFLINDCDDDFTINCLKNLKKKYGSKIIIKHNKENLGFVKTANYGMSLSDADYVLLLNTDCLVSKNTIGKLVNKMEADKKIGLICPISSNAANLSYPIPEGFGYTQVDEMLERKFGGKIFDACTIVGNCLMISRECIEKVGYLDEAYGTGYGEETDYQFKAMKKGFKAKVAIDTYVFHKSEASFGTSKEKQERLKKNRDLFFSRWKNEYEAELRKYEANDPIKYINANLSKEDLAPRVDTLFYIDGIVQNAGGVHVVVDIVNYLIINGKSANIVFNLFYPYKEITLFEPIDFAHVREVDSKTIVSTVWKTAFSARELADKKGLKLISFIQGYEAYFEGGNVYGGVETSYKLADSILTISRYLKGELKKIFSKDSYVIPNGINRDLIGYEKDFKKDEAVEIAIILRNNVMKGDWLLLDIIKRLDLLDRKINLNVVTMNRKTLLPNLTSKNIDVNYINGPLDRLGIYKLLQKSDFYLDASLSEGFGLTALQAMAAGCVPIVSNSLGVNEYIKNMRNGVVVDAVNNPDSYVAAIGDILGDEKLIAKLKNGCKATSEKYDFEDIVHKYIEFFDEVCYQQRQFARNELNEQDLEIIGMMKKDKNKHSKKIAVFNAAKKVIPKPVKSKIMSLVEKIYLYNN